MCVEEENCSKNPRGVFPRGKRRGKTHTGSFRASSREKSVCGTGKLFKKTHAVCFREEKDVEKPTQEYNKVNDDKCKSIKV